jgi:hypothetical protein
MDRSENVPTMREFIQLNLVKLLHEIEVC